MFSGYGKFLSLPKCSPRVISNYLSVTTKIRPIFSIILNLSSTGRYAGSAARLTNAWRSHETPFGRLTCITKFNYSIILIYSVYWAIDNINVKANSYRLLNQLGVTAPIESLHNLIETYKSDRPE